MLLLLLLLLLLCVCLCVYVRACMYRSTQVYVCIQSFMFVNPAPHAPTNQKGTQQVWPGGPPSSQKGMQQVWPGGPLLRDLAKKFRLRRKEKKNTLKGEEGGSVLPLKSHTLVSPPPWADN